MSNSNGGAPPTMRTPVSRRDAAPESRAPLSSRGAPVSVRVHTKDTYEASLADTIRVHDLLSIAQQADDARSVEIDSDEQALIYALLPAFNIDSETFNAAALEYQELRRGKNAQVNHVLTSDDPRKEEYPAYKRLHGLAYLVDKITSQERAPANVALRWVLGHYGSLFGCPVDDVRNKDTPAPLDVYEPQFLAFTHKLYKRDDPEGFLTTTSDASSALLFADLMSRHYQSKLIAGGQIKLDERSRQAYNLAGKFIGPISRSVFEFTASDLFTQQRIDAVKERDGAIHREVLTVLSGGECDDSAVELRNLRKLRKAYESIAADGDFSPSEYALFNYALKGLGIRGIPTRDLILNVQRGKEGNVQSFDFENMSRLYTRLFGAELESTRGPVSRRV